MHHKAEQSTIHESILSWQRAGDDALVVIEIRYSVVLKFGQRNRKRPGIARPDEGESSYSQKAIW